MKRGKVYIVGAGPGDPELLTVKAQRLIGEADAVVYDRLVAREIIDLIPTGVMRIDVGKRAGLHPVPQDQINALLVRLAASGRRVVRLKGGDPFTFGRGGEEAESLAEAGLAFEVVPGITSASGSAAALGIPLTHRGVATSLRYITGHCRSDAELDFDWQGLADPDTTLVVYMGLANIGQIVGRLVAAGLPQDTPVAAVANGTTSRQSHVVATLGTISSEVETIAEDGPVLFVIGKVVGLAGILGQDYSGATRQTAVTPHVVPAL
jgi:uroporphyrin-III C-methyltransferase